MPRSGVTWLALRTRSTRLATVTGSGPASWRRHTRGHLHHEEADLEPFILPHLESPEWKAVEKRLRPASLADSGRWMAWVQDGMSPQERAYFRATIPAPVTFLLSRVAGRSYYREVAPAWRATV
jgi:hypothetical protein